MRHPVIKRRATAVAVVAALAVAGLPATTAAAATVVTVQVTDTAPRGDG